MKAPKPWMYIKYFSRLDKKPRTWHLIFLIPWVCLEKNLPLNALRPFVVDYLRQFKAVMLPTENKFINSALPEIELLCVVAGKDLELIPMVVRQAILTSGNKISRVSLVTRQCDLANLASTIKSADLGIAIEVINEDDLLSEPIREKILSHFGERYGWVLQQFLALEFILNSQSSGVLLVNADTILLRRMDWLNSESKQIMLVSTEYHAPYYHFLNGIIGSPINPPKTFVTHHMLFQPSLLREIFNRFELEDTENLLNESIRKADLNSESPVCVEFELYGQGLSKISPELIEYRKFSNCTWPRSDENLKKISILMKNSNSVRWNSISVHDYA